MVKSHFERMVRKGVLESWMGTCTHTMHHHHHSTLKYVWLLLLCAHNDELRVEIERRKQVMFMKRCEQARANEKNKAMASPLFGYYNSNFARFCIIRTQRRRNTARQMGGGWFHHFFPYYFEWSLHDRRAEGRFDGSCARRGRVSWQAGSSFLFCFPQANGTNLSLGVVCVFLLGFPKLIW